MSDAILLAIRILSILTIFGLAIIGSMQMRRIRRVHEAILASSQQINISLGRQNVAMTERLERAEREQM